MPKGAYLLYEAAAGYSLFEVIEAEEIGAKVPEVEAAINDLQLFSKFVKYVSFVPFKDAQDALSNINDISEGIVNDTLKDFLELNLPKVKEGKKAKFWVGVSDAKLGNSINEGLGFPCKCEEITKELLRGVRNHFHRFVKELDGGNQERAQLGLGHSYSRCKVKFNVNRNDNMIIQAISLLDQLDKDINTFSMRCREWYSWHFPEMNKIVKDNFLFCRCASLIQMRSSFDEAKLKELKDILMDNDEDGDGLADQVANALKTSMGMDISVVDMFNVKSFADRVISLTKYRHQLYEYLNDRMDRVAPNLKALIGEVVGARLISHAGSLTNLAKAPASTVQILGAEKALFRALKTRGNTPKYGLIFHSSFIGRAGAKNKGRISRYLANKCSIASRIDAFSEVATKEYGEMMKSQVEERLKFYDTGDAPRKNIDCMNEVGKSLKRSSSAMDVDNDDSDDEPKAKKKKKEKKDKKKKKKKKKKSSKD